MNYALPPKSLDLLTHRLFKRLLLLVVLIFSVIYLFGQSPARRYKPDLFKNLKNIKGTARVDSARAIYKNNCRKMNEADAVHSLNDLDEIAKAESDLPLECAVFDMRADYYSVNRGFNPLSTQYHNEAIKFAQEHNLTIEEAVYLHRKAVYLMIYKQNLAACSAFLYSQEKFKEIGYNKIPGMGDYFSQVADFYYRIGDYDNARANLKEALKYQLSQTRGYLNIVNTIGLTYRNTGHYGTALSYFERAHNIAKAMRDSVWIDITRGNAGSVYFLQKQYDKALPLIKADYATSLKYKQTLNAAIALLRLITIDIETNKLDSAYERLNIADSLLDHTNEDVLPHRVTYYRLKALFSEKTSRHADAKTYQEKFHLTRDSLELRDNLEAVERVRLQWELARSKEGLIKLRTAAEVGAYKRNTVIIVLGLSVVIMLLVYNRRQLKAKKDRELLASEKLRLDEELKNASLELHGYTENLMQKNLIIEEFRTEIEKLKLKFDSEDGARTLEKMMEVHIMTEENWTEFKKLFNKVHPAFFYRLRNKYPHVTDTDVRLMALIKLNLNNREMAGMLGITTDGVKKAKQRLRKKMELEGAEIEDAVAGL